MAQGAKPIALGVVGIGKIARDQHLPAIAGNDDIALIAAASLHPFDRELIRYANLEELLAGEPQIEAVSFCTPPQGRYDLALRALRAGKHVMIEKPPGATVREVELLAEAAAEAARTLFVTWHSREAAGVDQARRWLADVSIESVRVDWQEDVRVWHPGQDWIFEPGGLGVFDPGINALSILSRILPAPLRVAAADLVFPANRQAPISAEIVLRAGEVPIAASLDFLKTGHQRWDIEVETDRGRLRLERGGAILALPGQAPPSESKDAEYARLYERFVRLIRSGQSDVDISPLKLVADAFLLGRRHIGEAFEF